MVGRPVFCENEWDAPLASEFPRCTSRWISNMQMNQIEIRSLLGCAEQGAGDVPHDRLARSEVEDAFGVGAAVPHGIGRYDLAGGHRCREPNFTAVQGGNGLDVPFHEVAQGAMHRAGVPAGNVQNARS